MPKSISLKPVPQYDMDETDRVTPVPGTYVIFRRNEKTAHITTVASITFQISRRYEPGCRTTP